MSDQRAIGELVGRIEALERQVRADRDWIATVRHHGDQIDGLLGDVERNRKLVTRLEALEAACGVGEHLHPYTLDDTRALVRAARDVASYDWSDNDAEPVHDMERLRDTLKPFEALT